MTLTITYATTVGHTSCSPTPSTRNVALQHFRARATINSSLGNASVVVMVNNVASWDITQTRCRDETVFFY